MKKENFMKSYRKELWYEIPLRMVFVNITRDVAGCLKESGIREGFFQVKTKESVFLRELFHSNSPVKFVRESNRENSNIFAKLTRR